MGYPPRQRKANKPTQKKKNCKLVKKMWNLKTWNEWKKVLQGLSAMENAKDAKKKLRGYASLSSRKSKSDKDFFTLNHKMKGLRELL